MSNVRLRYIRGWVDRKTGKAYWRFRRRGYKEVTLPGLPGSSEFMAAYQQALDQAQIPIGAKRTRAGTVNAALVGYYDSTMFFGSLAPSTQAIRRQTLERFRAEHGDKPIAELPPKFITLTLNKLRPSVARNWFKAIRHLMQYALSVDLCKADPTQGLKLPKARTKEHRPWADHEVAAYEATHAIGTKARLAFALGYYTAQRRGDALRMGRQHLRGGFLQIRQEKTGAVLDVPVHPKLQAIIDVTAGDMTFLTSKTGKPYNVTDFSNHFRQWCAAAGLPNDCHFHGLRYSAARALAEAGCTPHEIAAITGHATLSMVQKYSKGVEQRRMASAAMTRRTDHERKSVKSANLLTLSGKKPL